MDDLISRKEILSALPLFNPDQNGYPLNAGIQYARVMIGAAKTVDAKPVRQGRWIERVAVKDQVYCSECGTIEKKTDSNYKSPFCPGCSAQMDRR